LIILLVFYFLAVVQIVLALLSLRGGFRFRNYIQFELDRPKIDFKPFASVIVPCRGLDQGLRENLTALFALDYPCYELLFVVDAESDPAHKVISDLCNEGNALEVSCRILIAGASSRNSQKVHNLIHAVHRVDPKSEFLVFVDSDARPHAGWLSALIEPLSDVTIGATTGYRWFVPVRGGFTAQLRSVWNASIASALGADRKGNFCWGGSTAIRRTTFNTADVEKFWRGAASDDFAMMHALRAARLPIHFVASCLIPSYEDCTLHHLFEFTTRQMKITRVYAEPFWKAVLIGAALFVPVFFGLALLVVTRLIAGGPFLFPLVLFLTIFFLGAAKAAIRLKCVEGVFKTNQIPASLGFWSQILLWPLGTGLFLFNSLAALFSRRIEWRGIVYELNSPTETAIIQRFSQN
jgi:cellulose synthase/poly-beta-1,6-N-acetylglucosamine synthase-like glycosyltransferase